MGKPMQNEEPRHIMDLILANMPPMDEEKSIGCTKDGDLLVVGKHTLVIAPLSISRWPRSWRESRLYTQMLVTTSFCILLLWQWGVWSAVVPFFETRQVATIPDYVLDYAPLVWLDQAESHFPSDMFAQVQNTYPAVNFTNVTDAPSPLTLSNLDLLNAYGDGGANLYLTSSVDVTTNPPYLTGVIPSTSGKTNNATSAAIIVTDHGNGAVDAFYMYFYAYNEGNTVLGQELGDHIGDWEHNMVRFANGTPQAVWYSQHSNGEAFLYSVVEKQSIRPISYSARGSHANYAIAGTHDHTIPDLNLPDGFLLDYTSQGTLWDPLLNAYFYTFDSVTSSFSAAAAPADALASGLMESNAAPVGAMQFKGRWGDDQYPSSDPRQKEFFGFYKFVGGPTGPYDKQLNRTKVCPDNGILCIIRSELGP